MSGLVFERDGAIARLQLARPEVGNAIDIPLARTLMETAIACDEDDAIRCVVLTGAGKLFCAGGDVGSFAAAAEDIGPMLREITAYLHHAVARLARMNKPLVTVIHGPAAGAGVGLAALGDIALAGRSAHFTMAYAGVGLSPDGGTTWLLPRLIGLRRAQELILTNRRVGAEEAAAIGLVTRVVDDDVLVAEADALAANLVHSPIRALGRARALLAESFSTSLEAQMDCESRAIAASGRDEGREGFAAFLARRKPDFR